MPDTQGCVRCQGRIAGFANYAGRQSATNRANAVYGGGSNAVGLINGKALFRKVEGFSSIVCS
jgi:hypothetical protein